MNRYSRNILTIGEESQISLSQGSVIIIGCGALGGQIAMLLAGAGVGKIGLADFDTIDISNLQRQLFFEEKDAGKKKLEVLKTKMSLLNSEIEIDDYPMLITENNADGIFGKYDFIIDATDNPASKFGIDKICIKLGKPHCTGGVAGWKGQVISHPGSRGEKDKRYKSFCDIFPRPMDDYNILPCSVEGVIGAAASVIASIQAGEAIKYFCKNKEMLYNKLLVVDLQNNIYQVIDVL